MKLIDGKGIANSILIKLTEQISQHDKKPVLGIILVGDDAASQIYVKNKINDAHKAGITTELREYQSIDEEGIINLVEEWNRGDYITGYIIQLPLPLDKKLVKILEKINPKKDVDGLSPVSLGAAWQKNYELGYLPATVLAVKECLKHVAIYSTIASQDFEIKTSSTYSDVKSQGIYENTELNPNVIESKLENLLRGKNVVIVNDSLIVGRPLAALMLNYGATITIAHKYTQNLSELTQKADILMTGTGVIGLINGTLVKDGAILIDIGIKKDGEGKIKGDIDFESTQHLNGWITPVPNGVGPLTRVMLLVNTYMAFTQKS